MNKAEIAAVLRQEVGELEASIKKVQARCEKLKRFVLDLEGEIEGPVKLDEQPTKFRKMIDSVFGEEPKKRKR